MPARKKVRKKKLRKAPRRPSRRVTIVLEFTSLRGEHGEAEKIDDDEYIVRIHAPDPPVRKYLTFVHEIAGHVGSWLFLPFLDDRREHRFIAALEASTKRHWRKYWEGKPG